MRRMIVATLAVASLALPLAAPAAAGDEVTPRVKCTIQRVVEDGGQGWFWCWHPPI